MKTPFKSFCILLSTISCLGLQAQINKVEVSKNLNYKQSVTPKVLDNYLFSTFYGADKKSYNMKGFAISNSSYAVRSIKVNPAGASYAVLSDNGKKSQVEVFDTYVMDKKLHEFKDVMNPTAIAYSADSRYLFIAAMNGTIHMYDSRSYTLIKNIELGSAATQLVTSSNGYFIAASLGANVAIVNISEGRVRTTINAKGVAKDISFSEDSQSFGVLSSVGTLSIYDTRTFSEQNTIGTLGAAASFSFHPEGKYVAVVTADNMITFANMTDESDRPTLSDMEGNISYVRFLKDGKHQIYLSYNSFKTVKYRQLKGFSPNYTKLLRDELASRMEEWSKMRDDETIDEYKARVNEETRIKQARLFEQEIATRMADNMVMSSNVSLGSYNPEKNLLTVNFDNMPPMYLNVPENEVQDFMSVENLEFRDAVYGLTKDDKFELIYANVYNKLTGKTYEFNNLERQSLDYLSADSDFVPIELVQQSGMEEVKLNDIKKKVVDLAKQNNLISDHTHINVKTSVLSDVDANGNKITNYKVGFAYTVDGQYSAHEDFAAGKYRIEQSHAAESMLQIVCKAFDTDFAQYLVSGKKVVIKFSGSADAIPINGTIAYDGVYGEFINEPCMINGDLSTMTVTKAQGIKKNEQLAFIRAMAVKDYIQKNVSNLSQMSCDYKYNVELSDKTGGEHRRINVEFTFIDAF